MDPYFSRVSQLDGETLFFFFFLFEKPFKKMVFGVAAYFSFFLRENKINHKNPSATSCLENICLRNRVQIQRSCYLLRRYDSEP